MDQNVGRGERIVRLLGGLVLVLAALAPFAGFLPFRLSSLLWAAIPAMLLVVGVLLILTGATGRSIVYSVFGIRSVGRPDEESEEDDHGEVG